MEKCWISDWTQSPSPGIMVKSLSLLGLCVWEKPLAALHGFFSFAVCNSAYYCSLWAHAWNSTGNICNVVESEHHKVITEDLTFPTSTLWPSSVLLPNLSSREISLKSFGFCWSRNQLFLSLRLWSPHNPDSCKQMKTLFHTWMQPAEHTVAPARPLLCQKAGDEY